MKTSKLIILVVLALFLNSCLVKSLHPFYTKDKLVFNEKLIGQWVDNKKGEWKIESFVNAFEEDRKHNQKKDQKISKEDKEMLNRYEKGYLITYLKKEKEAQFIAMPFKIDTQYFIDFIPIAFEDDEINSLAASHLLKTHSVAKLDINQDLNEKAILSWLSEERITDLLNENKIRISHLKAEDMFETLLLTASSKELYVFLKKYMNTDIEDKWKDSDRLTLIKSDAKP